LAKLGTFLRHPLVIAALAAAFSALLIPHFTRQWQDRQREQELKQSLLEEISTSSTTAVRQAISLAGGQNRAAGGETGEGASDVYAVLRNSWLIRRASARSRIIVYFPNLYGCWYSYERAVADYLSLSPLSKSARNYSERAARMKLLRQYVTSNFAHSYVDPTIADGCAPLKHLPDVIQTRFKQLEAAADWKALTLSSDKPAFRASYAVLGEALAIGMERIITTIETTPARGFSHGIAL
jgi:hypothetical protein